MKKREIDRFFHLLSHRFNARARILLTGAGAGSVMGKVRATMDLDFAARLNARAGAKKERLWQEFAKATRETTLRTGIAVQYAEDIDRWSSITYLDYDKHTVYYKQFGKINVRLLAPAYWAIGKLTRYLDLDIRDLIEVLYKNKTPWRSCCRLWGRALRQSPKSTACELFRRQVEHFLNSCGSKIWGKTFDSSAAIREFHKTAEIR